MLKIEDLKVGDILVKSNGEGAKKLLGICGEVCFLSEVNEFYIFRQTKTIQQLNNDFYKIDEKKESEPQVGQVWEDDNKNRILITRISNSRLYYFRGVYLSCSDTSFDAGQSTVFKTTEFISLSKNQSREIILKDES